MKKTYKTACGLCLAFALMAVTGCKKDKLVMSTTENTREITEEETATVDEMVTEEASDEEKAITLEQLFEANKGDVLIGNTAGFGAEIVFYSEGEESGREYYFVGFDSEGGYIQACEDSTGVYRVLDHKERCWYVSDGNAVYTLIYPETDIFEKLVDYYHNDTVYTRTDSGSSMSERITDVYRMDGKLVVETVISTEAVDGATYRYILNDDYVIEEYTCTDAYGNVVVTEKTSLDITYDMPAFAEELKNRDAERTITVKCVDDGTEDIYYVSAYYPVCFEAFEGIVYTDEECQNVLMDVTWEDEFVDENGLYMDQIVYYSKN